MIAPKADSFWNKNESELTRVLTNYLYSNRDEINKKIAEVVSDDRIKEIVIWFIDDNLKKEHWREELKKIFIKDISEKIMLELWKNMSSLLWDKTIKIKIS